MFSLRAPTSAGLVAALPRSQGRQAAVIERLAQGTRVSRAADDAAGLGVATNLHTERRSLEMARRNVEGALEMSRVAEGGLVEITDMLQRMRELAIASASETIADDERAYLQDEYNELLHEIDRSARKAEFDGRRLLAPQSIDIAILIDQSDSMGFELANIQAEIPRLSSLLAAQGLDANFAIVGVSTLGDAVDGNTILYPLGGSYQSTLASFALTGVGGMDPYGVMLDLAGLNPLNGTTNPDSLLFRTQTQQKVFIYVSDAGQEVDLSGIDQATTATMLANAGFTVHTITNAANNAEYSTLTAVTGGTLNNMTGFGLNIDTAIDNISANIAGAQAVNGYLSVQAGVNNDAASQITLGFPTLATPFSLGIDTTTIATSDDALDAIDALDAALDLVNEGRSGIGANMNRLESALNNQMAYSESLAQSESVIRDADYALETSELAREQVISQATIAAMVQAGNLDRGAISSLLG
jgi:flagellin